MLKIRLINWLNVVWPWSYCTMCGICSLQALAAVTIGPGVAIILAFYIEMYCIVRMESYMYLLMSLTFGMYFELWSTFNKKKQFSNHKNRLRTIKSVMWHILGAVASYWQLLHKKCLLAKWNCFYGLWNVNCALLLLHWQLTFLNWNHWYFIPQAIYRYLVLCK